MCARLEQPLASSAQEIQAPKQSSSHLRSICTWACLAISQLLPSHHELAAQDSPVHTTHTSPDHLPSSNSMDVWLQSDFPEIRTRLSRLIKKLDDDDFQTRQSAQHELIQEVVKLSRSVNPLSQEVLDALSYDPTTSSIEVKERLRLLFSDATITESTILSPTRIPISEECNGNQVLQSLIEHCDLEYVFLDPNREDLLNSLHIESERNSFTEILCAIAEHTKTYPSVSSEQHNTISFKNRNNRHPQKLLLDESKLCMAVLNGSKRTITTMIADPQVAPIEMIRASSPFLPTTHVTAAPLKEQQWTSNRESNTYRPITCEVRDHPNLIHPLVVEVRLAYAPREFILPLNSNHQANLTFSNHSIEVVFDPDTGLTHIEILQHDTFSPLIGNVQYIPPHIRHIVPFNRYQMYNEQNEPLPFNLLRNIIDPEFANIILKSSSPPSALGIQLFTGIDIDPNISTRVANEIGLLFGRKPYIRPNGRILLFTFYSTSSSASESELSGQKHSSDQSEESSRTVP